MTGGEHLALLFVVACWPSWLPGFPSGAGHRVFAPLLAGQTVNPLLPLLLAGNDTANTDVESCTEMDYF
ncbi:unnamed protein product [Menidia menidia]|uniref:(Atlantic silverside) hypothetical protein n=1 Tax=Menidia menidia TaxID=238744 RepID=A0A8S4B9K2_9TELE|nr:unnamed protein product [Menidia menidia]